MEGDCPLRKIQRAFFIGTKRMQTEKYMERKFEMSRGVEMFIGDELTKSSCIHKPQRTRGMKSCKRTIKEEIAVLRTP
jgi:hypothetical protein